MAMTQTHDEKVVILILRREAILWTVGLAVGAIYLFLG